MNGSQLLREASAFLRSIPQTPRALFVASELDKLATDCELIEKAILEESQNPK
jgi:hypothetical protein